MELENKNKTFGGDMCHFVCLSQKSQNGLCSLFDSSDIINGLINGLKIRPIFAAQLIIVF